MTLLSLALRSEIVIVLGSFLIDAQERLAAVTTVNGAQRFAKPEERPPEKTEDEDELEDDYDYLL